MKNMKSASILALVSLFLMIPFLLITKAQSQTSSPKLEGTAWRVTATDWYPIRDIPIFYGFGEGGRADVLAFVTYQSIAELPHIEYDRLGDIVWNAPWKVAPGTSQTNYKEIHHTGTYKRNGLSIHLEFADHVIDATINGNLLEGEIKSTQGDPRGMRTRWSAERVIVGSNSSSDAARKGAAERASGGSTKTSSKELDKGGQQSSILGLADDLGDSDDLHKRYLRNYEAQVSGTFKIGIFSGAERGMIKIEIDVRKMDNLKANFTLSSMSGELSGKIYDNGRLQLQGVGVLKGTLSETRYQCSITALAKQGDLTEGKYYCQSGNDVLQGDFNAALVKNNK